jgi:hypothetical protein
MRKILIAVAAMIAAATGLVSTPSTSDARGFRFGIGFGVPLRALIHRRVRPQVIILRRMERARARSRDQAAARSAAIRAQRAAEARADARARQHKAMQAKAAPKPSAPVSEEEALRKAQLEQQAKAEELVRQLSGYKPTSTTQPSKPSAAPAPEAKGPEGRIAAPRAANPPQAEPAPKAAPQPASCKRFLPGADAIVSVPCTQHSESLR